MLACVLCPPAVSVQRRGLLCVEPGTPYKSRTCSPAGAGPPGASCLVRVRLWGLVLVCVSQAGSRSPVLAGAGLGGRAASGLSGWKCRSVSGGLCSQCLRMPGLPCRRITQSRPLHSFLCGVSSLRCRVLPITSVSTACRAAVPCLRDLSWAGALSAVTCISPHGVSVPFHSRSWSSGHRNGVPCSVPTCHVAFRATGPGLLGPHLRFPPCTPHVLSESDVSPCGSPRDRPH